jgi:hypothetical protein
MSFSRARLLLLLGIIAVCLLPETSPAETREAFFSRLEPMEELAFPKIPIRFELDDVRVQQPQNIGIKALVAEITDSMTALGYHILSPLDHSRVKPVEFRFEVSYFGGYRTEAKGKPGVRCLAYLFNVLKSTDRDDQRFSVSFDRLLDGDLKYLEKRKNRDSREKYLVDQVAHKTIDQMLEVLETEQAVYRQAVTLGSALVDTSLTTSQNEKRAIVDALRRSCERAWGVRIESTVEIVDITDVSDFVSQHYGCKIIDYELLTQHSIVSDDGYVCVVVKSISQESR